MALTPLFYELFSKTILPQLYTGMSWPNHVHFPQDIPDYPLHAPKLRLSEPVHALAVWYCCNITVPHCPNFTLQLSGIGRVRESVRSGVSLRSRSVNNQAMEECKLAAEMKGNVFPTVKDVIGHYFFVRSSLMCSTEKHLHKRQEFNVSKDEVVDKIEAIWEKSSLPTMGRKLMETKLRNVLKKYAVMKTRRTESDKLPFENLFDVSACKCNHVEVVVRYGKVCYKCPRQSQIPVQGKMCL